MPSPPANRPFLTFLVVLAVVLLAVVVRPLASALFIAAVLAGTTYPVFRWLARRLGGRPKVAAILVTFGVVVAILLPLSAIVGVLVREGLAVLHAITGVVEAEGPSGLLDHLPGPLRSLATRFTNAFPGAPAQIQSRLAGAAQGAAAVAAGLAQTTGSVLLQSVLMLVALYAFLLQGRELIDYLDSITPLAPGQTRTLIHEFRKVASTVLVSSIATSAVQAVVALAGYAFTGMPNPVFASLVTFFFAFIPGIGAGGVGLACAIYLVATGHLVPGIILAVWSVAVVGLVDNVVKPLFIKGGVEMNGIVIFFALIGGLAAFGGVGLVAGPMIVAFFLSLMRLRRDERERESRGIPEGTEGTELARALVSKGTAPSTRH
jgi:predicted PurR-regulated permease PerM